MSEYQYYEFQAIDRPLSDRDMQELRALSTRAEITRTSFTNEYHWGDFKGNVGKVLEKYFDAFFYFANWGTHRFMVRLPRSLVDGDTFRLYGEDEHLSLRVTSEHVLLDFTSGGEDADGEEDAGSLDDLVAIRAELLAGDLRSLYIGWLSGVSENFGLDYPDDNLGADALEPPVPPGLSKLTPAQSNLAAFLRVDEDLLAAAAVGDTAEVPTGPTREELAAWLAALPASEKDAALLRVLNEESPHLRADLLQRFRAGRAKKSGTAAATAGSGRRTIGQLLALHEEKEQKRHEAESRRRAAEKAKRDREEAAARTQRLNALAARETETWSEVETLIASKVPKNYDRAVALLRDLVDLAARAGKVEHAQKRIADLRGRHSAKSSFQERLRKAGL